MPKVSKEALALRSPQLPGAPIHRTIPSMARFEFQTFVAAPPTVIFDLWTNLDRSHEWLVGMSKVTDVTGPLDRPGATYVMWFSGRATKFTVEDVDRPRYIRSRLGSGLFRGITEASFEPDGEGTRLIQAFEPEGLGPTIAAWIFSKGAWRGSFRGELNTFKRIAEREARQATAPGQGVK